MASVPSAGCLLAKNQYYRTRLNSESSVSSSSSCCSDAVNVTDQEKAFHVPTVEKDSVMDLPTEMLCTDLFFQEAWDLPDVWVQLQEENKSFRKVEKCVFKIFVSSLNDIA
ncbi:hypothetical protein BTVI_127490 [Pitangus sulphuratus]|nr:hypothetical protein BTVI_127490 [Pitangus sulphuratus]